MARYSSGMTAAGAGSTVLPVLGILGTATVSAMLREASIYNTTATACTYRLVNFTGGTAGTAQLERRHRRNSPVATCQVFGLWTVAATIGEDLGYHVVVGAGAGNGTILTFGDTGLETELGATSGIGWVPIGTGQICELNFTFDE